MSRLKSYSKTQTETASPERLMVLLFEAALRHLRTAAAALEASDATTARPALFRASEIVLELMSTLDRPRAPALADRLGDVYQFVALRITRALTTQDAAAAREAERAFAPIAGAFSEAVAQLPSAAPETR